PCGRLLGLPDPAEQPRSHEPDEQAEHDDDHQQLDQGEPALIAARAQSAPAARAGPAERNARRARQGAHTRMSLTEKMASSMSTTTARAPSTGTPLLSMVPSVRRKRAVSTFIVRDPTRGVCRSKRSHWSRPSGVPVHSRQPSTTARIPSTPAHQYACMAALT